MRAISLLMKGWLKAISKDDVRYFFLWITLRDHLMGWVGPVYHDRYSKQNEKRVRIYDLKLHIFFKLSHQWVWSLLLSDTMTLLLDNHACFSIRKPCTHPPLQKVSAVKPRSPSEFMCPLVGGMDIFWNSTLSGNDMEWKGKLDKYSRRVYTIHRQLTFCAIKIVHAEL